MMEKDVEGRSKQEKVQTNGDQVGSGGLWSISGTTAP